MMKIHDKPALRMARLSVLIAVAIALSYVERLIPLPVPVPGIKLGLANLCTLVALYLFGWRDALIVSALRVLLGGAMFGSGFSIVYALTGAASSLLAMVALKRLRLHIVTVSAVGGLVHNMAQLALAAAILRTGGLFAYAPALCVCGLSAGFLTGVIANELIRRLASVMIKS